MIINLFYLLTVLIIQPSIRSPVSFSPHKDMKSLLAFAVSLIIALPSVSFAFEPAPSEGFILAACSGPGNCTKGGRASKFRRAELMRAGSQAAEEAKQEEESTAEEIENKTESPVQVSEPVLEPAKPVLNAERQKSMCSRIKTRLHNDPATFAKINEKLMERRGFVCE